MTESGIRRGFYRHYKGHVYYVHGVGMDPHNRRKRSVVYTSVKTEEGFDVGLAPPAYDFLLRDEREFAEDVHSDGSHCSCVCTAAACDGAPRFARITDPERSVLAP
jgi:hypothetical protein